MATPLNRFSEFKDFAPLAHELPYWDFEGEIAILSDGTLVRGASIGSLYIETLTDDEINQKTETLRAFLNSLPDGLELSFMIDKHSDQESILNKHAAHVSESNPVYPITLERLRVIREQASLSRLFTFSSKLFIYRRQPKQSANGSFFSPPSHFVSANKEIHQKALSHLMKESSQVFESLRSVGITVEPLVEKDLWQTCFSFLNPGRLTPPDHKKAHRTQEFVPSELQIVPELSISSPREQLCHSDLILRTDNFELGGKLHKILSLKSLPEATHSALIQRLMIEPVPAVIHLHIRVPEQSKELRELQASRRMAHSLSHSNGRAADLENEAKLRSTEDLLRDIINSGQKIFFMQLSVLLRGTTEEEIDSRLDAYLCAFREMNGSDAIKETVANFPLWKTLLPAGNLTMIRPKRVKTDNLADYLPLFGPYHSSHDPVVLFKSSFSTLTTYDPFSPRLPNFNTLVTGSSGSGKSFLNNLILLQYAARKPSIFIIDIGGSYRKLCEFLGGQYMEISPGTVATTTINPFETVPGASAQKIKFLMALLQTMLSDEDSPRLTRLQKSYLEEKLTAMYAEKEHPLLSDYANLIGRSTDPFLQSAAKVLLPWIGQSPYGQFVDRYTTLKLDNPFVVFDLKGLSHYPDLQRAMILIITDFIMARVQEGSGNKMILMDECWELLKSQESQSFMEYCVRTLRKSGSGISFITQGIEEIVKSPIGAAIIANTATKFILSQRGDLDRVKNVLKLNDVEIGIVSGLRQSKGNYSQAFAIFDNDRTVLTIAPTPKEYWLATSNANDSRLFESLPGENTLTTLERLAKLYPRGLI